jgi:hypothetical protein
MKKNIEAILQELQFHFAPGFAGRVMKSLRESGLLINPGLILSERIYRAFYWVNAPGLAALLALILAFIIHITGNAGPDEAGKATTLNEYIYNFYLSSY